MIIFSKPTNHLIFLTLILIVVFSFWSPHQTDDGGVYQAFVEKIVNEGKIDLAIPGFHGADFLAVPIYFVSGSSYAIYWLDILAALVALWLIYGLVKKIYQNAWFGVVAAYIYVLMPFEVFNALRGGHQTTFFAMSLLAIYFLLKNKSWSWIIFGFSLIIRPFSIALAPFYLYQKKYQQLALSFIIPIIYITAQYLQIGRVIIGQHPELTTQKLFSLERFFLNIVYSIQNYFSIHNFSPLNPLYKMDMVHVSPFVTFFVVISVAYYKNFFIDKKIFKALVSSAVIAFLLPCSFYRVDLWYFGMFNLILVLLCLPAAFEFKKIWPLAVFTFAFQFFYFYLSYSYLFVWPLVVFLIPLAILIISVVYSLDILPLIKSKKD